jgi:hypothetical protein
MKTNHAKLARVLAALNAAGTARPFRCESSYQDSDAAMNLRGRTHYLDPDTVKYFKSRVNNSGRAQNDLLYWIVESVNSRPCHGGLNKRFVCFDVFGSVVNDRPGVSDAGWHRTSEQAAREGREFLASFDAVAHTAETLAANARRDIDAARRTLAALRPRKASNPAAV